MLIRCFRFENSLKWTILNQRGFHSFRTISSQLNTFNCPTDLSKHTNVVHSSAKRSNCSINKQWLLRPNSSIFTIQNRFESTASSTPITEAVKSSVEAIKKIDESEIDLSNFKIPDLPTPEQIEALNNMISAIDLNLTTWMPTGLLFTTFDWMYKHGCEWPVTIIGTTIFIRTLLVPITISTRRNAVKMNKISEPFKKFQEEVERVQMSGNLMELNKIAMKYQNVADKEQDVRGFKKWELMKMPLAQLFLFTSFFITLRAMCNYPIPSLQNTTFLWLPSLTEKDPFYLLPIITSCTLFVTLKSGIDMGTLGMTQANKVQKAMIYLLPLGSLAFTCTFPSALCIYWCTSNFHALLTAQILKQERVRKYFGIPDPVTQAKEAESTKKKSDFKVTEPVKSVKNIYENFKTKNNLKNVHKTDTQAFESAGKGPIIKTYKYDPRKKRDVI